MQPNYKKRRIIANVIIILYCVIVFIAGLIALIPLSKTLGEKSIGIVIVSLCILIIPPIILREVLVDFFTDTKIDRKNRKIELENTKKRLETQANEIRQKYNLPKEILTSYEYSKQNPSFTTKTRWILCGLLEALCLALTVGQVFIGDLYPAFIGVPIIFFGCFCSIYGFCVLFGKYLKGLYFSTMPVLCYALPLAIIYFAFKPQKDWILPLFTIIIGSGLLYIFLLFTLVLPIKKQSKIQAEYNELINKKYLLDCFDTTKSDYPRVANYFYKNREIHVYPQEENTYEFYLYQDIIYKGVKIDGALIYYEKQSDIDLDTANRKALSLLILEHF